MCLNRERLKYLHFLAVSFVPRRRETIIIHFECTQEIRLKLEAAEKLSCSICGPMTWTARFKTDTDL